jgi:hypothetical protein
VVLFAAGISSRQPQRIFCSSLVAVPATGANILWSIEEIAAIARGGFGILIDCDDEG